MTLPAIPASVPACFEQVVATYPDRLALVTETTTWTYAELNRQANRVAHGLLALATTHSEPVALLMDSEAPMMAAVLGILKAGKFFVILDSDAPDARLRLILDDVQSGWLTVDHPHEARAKALHAEGVHILTVESLLATPADENLALDVDSDAPMSLIFTSGSTGEPKGVIRTHRTTLLRVFVTEDNPDRGEGERLSQLTSLNFAMGLYSCFRALLNGRTLYLFDLKQHGVATLPAWLQHHAITYIRMNASLLRQFLNVLKPGQRFPALSLVHASGEPLYRADVERLRLHVAPTCRVRIVYGSSEVPAITTFVFPVTTALTEDIVPVGAPPPGVTVRIVDEQGLPVEPGQPGEIVAISRMVSPGYWRKPDLTDSRFAPVPGSPDLRLYRTGDLGRVRPDGMLEFIGRADAQVKIRGYRVGLPIIESTLLGLPSVKQAAVAALPGPTGDSRLVAYVVPAQPSVTASGLRAALAETLPDYMLPSTFILLDALPLTNTGKVDRQGLPTPGQGRPALAVPFAPPITPIERALADLWTDVLALDAVGIHDPFLDLGGDSLLASQIVARACRLFDVEVAQRDLFQTPTVADMAALIEQRRVTAMDGQVRRLLEEVERLTDTEAEQFAPS